MKLDFRLPLGREFKQPEKGMDAFGAWADVWGNEAA